jgi:hypothetical protein
MVIRDDHAGQSGGIRPRFFRGKILSGNLFDSRERRSIMATFVSNDALAAALRPTRQRAAHHPRHPVV